jgi:uncharacterized protein (DUF2062 family)
MFQRRKPRPRWSRSLDLIWPHLGWRRFFKFWVLRLSRLPGSANAVSAGFAFGAAVSFTPFMGFHILLGMLMSYAARASMLAAAIGTIVGNPWTFPFIWWLVYHTGVWMGIGGMPDDMANMNVSEIFLNAVQAFLEFDWNYLVKVAWPLLGPMLIGCLPYFAVAWVVFYFGFRWLIDAYGRKSREKLANRIPHEETIEDIS